MSELSGFSAIRTEGGLLPADLLARVRGSDVSLRGLTGADYHLAPGERISEQIARSWSRLVRLWRRFAADLETLTAGDPAAGATRERWLHPLFDELGYGRLVTARALEIDGKSYPVSHWRGRVPIHLVGAGTSLERRQAGVRGAASASPHGMVQELLNRSDDYLWAMISNGRQLRILRDNVSLTRQAFLEFDLETIFANEIYDEFVVLWLVAHESRLDPEDPAASWLERWREEAVSTGARALDALRGQVEEAIEVLGRGFLAYPDNHELRRRLRAGDLAPLDYYRQLLRLIYRLIFLLVAEDRGVLFHPDASELAQRHYRDFYGVGRLRDLAQGRSGRGPHPDLWCSLLVVIRGLGSPSGVPELGVPALGSFLWSEEATADLDASNVADTDLLAAVRVITMRVDREARLLRPIDYRNLGSDELGSIYEGLLELHPVVNLEPADFSLETFAGSERKSTGSYYTPDSLIAALLDSALTPLLDRASRSDHPDEALLDLRVLDPAAGSGHFLVAAGRRIAHRLASVRTGEAEPAPETVRHALRDVVGRCLYGIDVNPMALELAKISLWLEAIEPGRPLSFLDHHLVLGNALLGATPAMLARPIPDEAFKALSDDDKTVATAWRKSNTAVFKSSKGGLSLLAIGTPVEDLVPDLARQFHIVETMSDATLEQVEAKRRAYDALAASAEMSRARLSADAWCSVFFVPKRSGVPRITTSTVTTLSEGVGDPETLNVVADAHEHHHLLHWHLAFPEVFERGGFSLVVGNPPWEKVKLSEKEFFAARRPEIAEAAGARRKAMIARLEDEDPALWTAFREALRDAEAESLFLRTSGRFPLCGRGDINTYAVFAEVMRDALAPDGRLGVIVPTGIATDDTTKEFFGDCVSEHRLVSLFDFENGAPLFPGVHRSFKFCLLTLTGPAGGAEEAEFLFFARDPRELADLDRRFTLTPEDLALLNPNTKTAPVFRSRRDAELTTKIYRRVPVLVREDDPDGNPWGIEFSRMFDMTNDSGLFRTASELEALGAQLEGNVWRRGTEAWLPLYEAKMTHHFNHRWGDFAMQRDGSSDTQLPDISEAQLANPEYVVQPRYWVAESEVAEKLTERTGWLLGLRKVCRSTDERTVIASAVPEFGAGDSEQIIHSDQSAVLRASLIAVLSSFVVDYVARQKLGGSNLNFFVAKQLPVLPPSAFEAPAPWSPTESVADWMRPRVLELMYTAADMSGFADDLGYSGQPFEWEPERRRQLRADLDAACFHLYGLERDEVAHIMDRFPIVRRKDEAAFGEYRTKRMILEQYDALIQPTGARGAL